MPGCIGLAAKLHNSFRSSHYALEHDVDGNRLGCSQDGYNVLGMFTNRAKCVLAVQMLAAGYKPYFLTRACSH